jgi:hypothetical protein
MPTEGLRQAAIRAGLIPPAPPIAAAAAPPAPPADTRGPGRAEGTSLEALWRTRPCWICGARTWCGHRENRVDLAELTAWARNDAARPHLEQTA